MRAQPCVIVLVALAGCSASTGLTPLGVFDVETPFAVEPPQAPVLPTAPKLTPCPAGWVERAGPPTTCEPWVDDEPPTCSGDTAAFPGSATCQRVGSACPTGEWPDGLPTTGVLYVSTSAADGGTGSVASPFGTLGEAFAAATTGTTIALGQGTHALDRTVPAGLTLRGACVGGTTITRAATATKRVEVYVTQGAVTVQNLRITGTGVGAQGDGQGAHLTLEDVLVDGASGYGVAAVRSGVVTLHRVAIRNTQTLSTAQRGMEVALAGSVTGDHVSVEGDGEVLVHVTGAGSTASLSDLAVVGPAGSLPISLSYGVRAEEGGVATLERAIVTRTQNEAVSASANSHITLHDAVVRDTRVNASTLAFGDGLAARGGTITGTRVRLAANHHSGGVANGGGTLELTDAVIVGTAADRLGLGLGVLAAGGATVRVTRGLMSRLVALGVGADASSVRLEDVEVRDVTMPTPTVGGEALGFRAGTAAVLSRVSLSGHRGYALEAIDLGTTVSGGDLTVTGGLPGVDQGAIGLGLFQATGTLERVSIRDAIGAGVHLQGLGTRLTTTDLDVSGTKMSSQFVDGSSAVVMEGASLVGQRLSLRDGQVAGLFVDGSGSSLTASDLLISGTRLSCAASASCSDLVASGLAALHGGAAHLERFLLIDNAGIGLLQAAGGQLDASHGEVAFHDVGVNVGDTGYDLNRLSNDVRYVHNTQLSVSLSVSLPQAPVLTPSLPQ